MSGDPRCAHCGAPEPAYGEMEHGRLCPLATDKAAARYREPKTREEKKRKEAA